MPVGIGVDLGAARTRAPNNLETPMHLPHFPQYFGLPTQYFLQV